MNERNVRPHRQASHQMRAALRDGAARDAAFAQQQEYLREAGEGVGVSSYARALGVDVNGGFDRDDVVRAQRVRRDAVFAVAGQVLDRALQALERENPTLDQVVSTLETSGAALDGRRLNREQAAIQAPFVHALERLAANLYAVADRPRIHVGDFGMNERVPFGARADGSALVVGQMDDNPFQHLQMFLHELAHTTGAVGRLNRERVIAAFTDVELNGTLYEETVAQGAAMTYLLLLFGTQLRDGREWLTDVTFEGRAGMRVLSRNLTALVAIVLRRVMDRGNSMDDAFDVVSRVIGQLQRDVTDAVLFMMGQAPERDVNAEHREFAEWVRDVLHTPQEVCDGRA